MIKVLVIEEHPDELEQYNSLLPESQYEVEATFSLENALALCQKRPPDLIIINFMGLVDNAVEKIQKLCETYLDVILVGVSLETYEGSAKQLDRAKRLDIQVFIDKPFKADDFRDKIEKAFLDQKHQGANRAWQTTVNVLVVEDSKTAQKMYEMYVKNTKKLDRVALVFAGTGEAGLSTLESSEFELIILDWELPGMSGLEFLEKVRANEKWDDLPIIMCTSVSDKSRIMKAISQGVNDYIIKPVNVQAFTKKIHANLQS